MSTYIVHKTREWHLKHQSLSLPDSVLCLHTQFTRRGSGLWNTKAYHCSIVYYVYIHSSQDEGVVSETPKPIIARECTMSTYIIHKTREWSLKQQSLSFPDSVLCLHTQFTWRGSGLWNTKAYHCPIVYYVYIHSSQYEGVVSETPKLIIAR